MEHGLRQPLVAVVLQHRSEEGHGGGGGDDAAAGVGVAPFELVDHRRAVVHRGAVGEEDLGQQPRPRAARRGSASRSGARGTRGVGVGGSSAHGWALPRASGPFIESQRWGRRRKRSTASILFEYLRAAHCQCSPPQPPLTPPGGWCPGAHGLPFSPHRRRSSPGSSANRASWLVNERC